jgi:SAM-dependent methyltransferase
VSSFHPVKQVKGPVAQMTTELGIIEGRRAFGAGAANYDTARPQYPERVFSLLREHCGLQAGTRTFEVGPGTGLATRRLLELGASPLVAVEPDDRLAAVLRTRSPDKHLQIINLPFEDAELQEASFDLGVSATAFHWLDQRPALAKVATVLKPGGCWAMWWNVFGDLQRYDAFHEATQELLSGMATSPSQRLNWRHPFALDTEARIADLGSVGAFTELDVEILRWTLVLDPAQVRALYATYSQFSVLEEAERNRLLDGLFEIAAQEFGGRVERNMSTPIYTCRRR